MKLKTIYAKCTGVNWYTRDFICFGYRKYKVIDASWDSVQNRWELKITRIYKEVSV